MAETDYDQQRQQTATFQQPTDAIRSILPDKGPSPSQILVVATLLPIGGLLLFIAGITIIGTLIGLAVTTPLFIIFSPILIPAALAISAAVAGFLTSGAFGITALSSLSWMGKYLRSVHVGRHMEQAKTKIQETAGEVGKKAKEMGQAVQNKAQEEGISEEQEGAHEDKTAQEEGKAQTKDRSGGVEAAQEGKTGKAPKKSRSEKGGKAQESDRTVEVRE